MRAHVGDRLVVDGDSSRTALIIGLEHQDGSPPYVVRWLASGHIALVHPGPYARVLPAPGSSGDGSSQPEGSRGT
ncbi:MAG: DUF1918 domain-containing protein [Actinobacteria bacterium]|nr:DUF1918 domain-containing protein [Actinomycetota bacterium]